MARSNNQVVEVIPLMDGEDSPRRVLCPWRVHPPASTLPAVARATAGRFVRCEYLIGRGVCVLMGSSSSLCVSCSPHGWPSVVRGLSTGAETSGAPPLSRLSRTGEQLTQKPLAETLIIRTPRPMIHSDLTNYP